MKTRDFLLVGTICAGSALVVKAAQVSLTPEFWDWLAVAVDRLLASSGVGVLLLVTAVLFLLSLAARAWEVAGASAGAARQRAEEQARSYAPGRAPCGELAHGWRRCLTCGRDVVRETCGLPWGRARVTTGYHLFCGHGMACHAPSEAIVQHTPNNSGRPAA